MSHFLRPAIARWLRTRARSVLASTLAVGLAACGGGGGGGAGGSGGSDTLTVSLSYAGSALLLRPSRIDPNLTGLAGHAANCTLVSGTIPAGMTLNGDCSITGTPLVAGMFPITVRLAAAGVSNTLDWSGSVLVYGPSVIYSVPSPMMTGTSYDLATLNNFWTAGAGDAVTYSVSSGSLPAGLAIHPTTGRITGVPTTEGDYTFKITAQVVNAGRTATATSQFTELASVYRPIITYSQAQAFAGLPFQSTPNLPTGGATYAFSTTPALPAGLAIDVNTGVISGRPSATTQNTSYRVNLTGTSSTGTFTNFSDFNMEVLSPVYVSYASTTGHVDVPFSLLPRLLNNTTDPLTGISYSYALHPDSSLPPGLSLDAVTGEIFGTPTTLATMQATVVVTVSLYGTTFVTRALAGASMQ